MRNILPNTNWQLITNMSAPQLCAMNSQGTGTQSNIAVSSFSPNANSVVFSTADSGQLAPGAIVSVGGASFTAPLRVTAVNAGSFVATLPPWLRSPAISSAATVYPTSVLDFAGNSSFGPDGWRKTPSLVCWPDDFAINAAPGAVRVLGLRKQASAQELIYHDIPPMDFARYRGRNLSVAALIWQKTKSGGGTGSLFISIDGVLNYSTPGSGPVAGYELLQMSMLIPWTAKAIAIGFAASGTPGDVYYMATPTALLGSPITRDELGQPRGERIRANNHWNPTRLLSGAWTFPTTQILAGSGLYGWNGLDLGALSGGVMHNSIHSVEAKVEMAAASAGANLMTGSQINASSLVFGPQAISPGAIRIVGQGNLPLDDTGCFAMVVDRPGEIINNQTWDFWDVTAR